MRDKVFTICENLSKVGISPTAERVRNELGGGSFSNISPLIKEWRDRQKKIVPVPEIPPEALKAVHQATALIWSIASEHQTEAINTIKQEYSRSEQQAIADRDEAMHEVALLEEKLKASEKQVKALLAKDTARANEMQSLELQIHKQQLALDSTVNQNIELKAEVRELREKANIAQNESARLSGMLEAFKTPTTAPIPPAPLEVTDTVLLAEPMPQPAVKKTPSPRKPKTPAPKKTV